MNGRRSPVLRSIPLLLLCFALIAPPSGAESPIDLPEDRPLRAGFLVVNGVYNTELMAPWDVLQHTVYHSQPHPGIEVFAVAESAEPITTAEGLRILPDFSFETAPPIDILVIPSAEHSRDRDRNNSRLISWVRKVGSEAKIVMSLCWGAFIVAEAGLLDGHSCTTFPGDFDLFAETFPDLDLRINVSFVHDGQILTSQGGARSYDVAMYLVELLFGEATAKGVGGGLLIDWPMDPGRGPGFVSDPGMALQMSQTPD